MTTDDTITKQPSVYSVDEARDAILSLVNPPTATDTIPVDEAVGRVVANDIVAIHSIPSFRNSAMDGYAIRHEDSKTNNQFKLIGHSLAGHPFTGDLTQQGAVRITTGAFVPPSADTVVMQENTSIKNNNITIDQAPDKYQHIRNPGDDINSGTQLICRYQRLTPAHTGLLAAQGIANVDVYRKPRVGVFSTGDELCTSAESLQSGKIYDSNRASLRSSLLLAGIDAVDLGIAADSIDAMDTVFDRAGEFDFILSSGGVSVGEADFVKSALESNGELFFWKVAMKPGKPMVTGKLNTGAFYFGLPGNPVSSLVTCIQFVIPALRAFSGEPYVAPTRFPATCMNELHKEIGRFEFQRGIVAANDKGALQVETTGLQDSHVLSSLSTANCFICLDADSSGAKAGEEVKITLFDSLPGL